MGRRANILLLDLEIMKQIMVKEFNSFMEREVSHQRVCYLASLLSVLQFQDWKPSKTGWWDDLGIRLHVVCFLLMLCLLSRYNTSCKTCKLAKLDKCMDHKIQ